MKKVFAMLLALCLLCGGVALADNPAYDPKTSETPKTELQLDVSETYTVSIPSTLTIAYGATTTNLPVSCTMIRLLSTHQLCVKAGITSGKMTNADSDHEITFTLDNGAAQGDKDCFHFTATGAENFVVRIPKAQWDAAKAGAYKGNVTFSIGIQNK